jgi:acetoin utilization deacetylase AcuC-like enzyme
MIIYTHPACLAHDPGPEHPERPARLEAVLAGLRAEFTATWTGAKPRWPSLATCAACIGEALLREVLDSDFNGYRMLDPDTVTCPDSRAAALRAAGAAVAAVDAVMLGDSRAAFCAVRPPGHHATGDTAMGFCLLNNIAVAAAYACDRHGLERVAIVDFDVHHGNGTQAIFYEEPRVDLFQHPRVGPLPQQRYSARARRRQRVQRPCCRRGRAASGSVTSGRTPCCRCWTNSARSCCSSQPGSMRTCAIR